MGTKHLNSLYSDVLISCDRLYSRFVDLNILTPNKLDKIKRIELHFFKIDLDDLLKLSYNPNEKNTTNVDNADKSKADAEDISNRNRIKVIVKDMQNISSTKMERVYEKLMSSKINRFNRTFRSYNKLTRFENKFRSYDKFD